MNMPSKTLKSIVTYFVAITVTVVSVVGAATIARSAGLLLGKRLGAVILPLIKSDRQSRQLLGVLTFFTATTAVSQLAGVFGGAVAMTTFMSVHNLVENALQTEDWSKVDELAEELQARVMLFKIQSELFGYIPAILTVLDMQGVRSHVGRNVNENFVQN